MTPAAFILIADAACDFRDAVVLGQGLPAQVDGVPVKYAWKEALPLGSYLDSDNRKFSVDAARIDKLILNFKRAKEKAGFLPYLPPDHKTARGDKNFGFIVDARKGDNGSLELLHQLIGEDAALAAARNKTSICTVADVVDEHGNVYDELIDHNAILPNPRLNNLESFTPAIAASRGSVPATFFTLAAQRTEPMLDLKKLRAQLKAADDVSDEKVIELAQTRLTETEPLAAKLTAAENDLKLSRAEAADAKTKLAASESRVLELGRRPEPAAPPTPRELLILGRSLKSDRQAAIDAGGVNPDTAKELDKLLEKDGHPNELALSAVGSGTDDLLAFRLWSILKNNKPVPIGERTRLQTLSRQTPSDDPDATSEADLAKAGREQGKAYAQASGAK